MKKRQLPLCFLLLLACLLLAGCSAPAEPSAQTVQPTQPGLAERLQGQWTGQGDYADYLNRVIMQADSKTGSYIRVRSFRLTWELTFSPDGTYQLATDTDQVQQLTDSLQEDIGRGLRKMAEEKIRESGEELTLEDIEKQIGATIGQASSEIARAAVRSMMVAQTGGTYEIRDEHLYMDDNQGYFVLFWDGDSFEIEQYTGIDDEGMFITLFGGVVFARCR